MGRRISTIASVALAFIMVTVVSPAHADVEVLSHRTLNFPQYGVYIDADGADVSKARVAFEAKPDEEVSSAIKTLKEEREALKNGEETTLPKLPSPRPTYKAKGSVVEFPKQEDERESIFVVFLVDATQSMEGEPFQRVRRGVRAIARELRDDDRVAVVRFAEKSEVILAPTVGPSNAYRAVERMDIWTGRNTKIFDAISETVQGNTHKEIVKKSPLPLLSGRYFIVVFSDGLDRGSFIKADDLEGTIMTQTPRPIVITVGVSSKSNAHKDLKRVAHFAGNPNNFFDNPGPSLLGRAFADRLDVAQGQQLVTFKVPKWYWGKGKHPAQLILTVGDTEESLAVAVTLAPSTKRLDEAKRWRKKVDAVVTWRDDRDTTDQTLTYGAIGAAVLILLLIGIVVAVVFTRRSARRKAAAFNEIKGQMADQERRSLERDESREVRAKEELRRVAEQSRVPQAVLITMSGPMKGQRFGLMQTTCLVGRETDKCDLVFPSDDPADLRISRVHGKFERAGGDWNVTCVSDQGMAVAGRAIKNGESYPVRFGDMVEMGESAFEFTPP
jgi:Mg-chelatase subunit ChlD